MAVGGVYYQAADGAVLSHRPIKVGSSLGGSAIGAFTDADAIGASPEGDTISKSIAGRDIDDLGIGLVYGYVARAESRLIVKFGDQVTPPSVLFHTPPSGAQI